MELGHRHWFLPVPRPAPSICPVAACPAPAAAYLSVQAVEPADGAAAKAGSVAAESWRTSAQCTRQSISRQRVATRKTSKRKSHHHSCPVRTRYACERACLCSHSRIQKHSLLRCLTVHMERFVARGSLRICPSEQQLPNTPDCLDRFHGRSIWRNLPALLRVAKLMFSPEKLSP